MVIRGATVVLCWAAAASCGGRSTLIVGNAGGLPADDGAGPPSATPDAAAEVMATLPPDAAAEAARDTDRDAARDVAVDSTTGPVRAIAIAVGWYDACALLSDGTVECWGSGKDGELGNGSLADSMTPVRVTGVDSALSLSPGGYVRCAALRGGDVRCWGDDAYAVIQPASDSGLPSSVATAVDVSWMHGAKAIASTWALTCALLADGTLQCRGEYPVGSEGWSPPVSSGGIAFTLWDWGGCVLYPAGTVSCWGNDDEGQLGIGTKSFQDGGVPVGVTGVTAIASGESGFTCAILSDTSLWCWGADNTGQVGSGPLSCSAANGGSCSPLPRQVPGLTGVTAVTAGDSFACALLSDGTVACWGDNVNGELGNGMHGSSAYSFSPVAVHGLTGVKAISASGYLACALLDDGSVACWGADANGQTGATGSNTCATTCTPTPNRIHLP